MDKKKIGKYEVVIEKGDNIVKSASSIKLFQSKNELVEPPTFIKVLAPTGVRLGDIVLLEIEVISQPLASFQWFIGNKDIISYTKENKVHNIYITNKENVSCLCIENMTPELFGIITCRAENFGGSVACSSSLYLIKDDDDETIGQAPKFLSHLKPTVVMDGDPILLQCTIKGDPFPKVNWYRNGKLIEWARDIVIGRQKSGLNEICIKEAFPEMSGNYSCVATNNFGTSSSECVVTVEGSRTVLSV